MQREEPGRRNDKMKSIFCAISRAGPNLECNSRRIYSRSSSNCKYALLTCVPVWATGVTCELLV